MEKDSKKFVSFDGDKVGRLVGRARLADDVQGVRDISARIEHGGELWKVWALTHEGEVVSVGGDEGSIIVPEKCLADIEKLRKEYEEITGATCTVGIGDKLSQADKSLMAGKLRGGDMVVHWDEDVDAEVEEAAKEPETEQHKIADHYLKSEDAGVPDLKAKIAKILAVVKDKSKEISELAEKSPEMHESVLRLLNSLVLVAKELQGGGQEKIEPDPTEAPKMTGELEKEELSIPELPVGTVKNGKLKVKHWDGHKGWETIREGRVRGQDPAQHAVSVHRLNAK